MLIQRGLTKGGTVGFSPFDRCKTWITKAGAAVSTIKSLHRRRPYSHAVVVAGKLPFGNYSAFIGQTP
jgi:hypothetical protein